ncbi:MAG: ATP-dependent helicase [Candidatus Komeilibacteria bacterium]
MKVYKIPQSAGRRKPVDWRAELNDSQYEVVTTADGPCLVLAGAGSGKTRTIVYRVAYLLSQGVAPENILLLTFTNKAAREMINRVTELCGQYPQGLWAGTFHHIANRILRQHAKAIGFNNKFNILDSGDSKDLLKMCIKDQGIDPRQRRFPSPAVIQNIISYKTNAQQPLAKVVTDKHPQWESLIKDIDRLAKTYTDKKQNNQVMDFDDLLWHWYRLLEEHPTVKDKLAQQFLYILVDEYQDTNYLQAKIVQQLASRHKNILVVGDDAQSIYSFRAADIGNILQFPKLFPDSKTFKLETNYRSTPEILAVANDVIMNNPEQYTKKLRAVLPSQDKPQIIPCNSARQEAEFIASMILQLRDEGVDLPRIAVLFRASHHSQTLEMELNRRDIPYDYRGGIRFFERAHIKDAVSFLKIINNPADEISWWRVLNMQVGVGTATAEKIVTLIRNGQSSDLKQVLTLPISDLLSSRAKDGWNNLLQILQTIIKEQDKGVANLIRAIIESDYQSYLELQYPDWSERLSDIEQLAEFSTTYDDLTSFLAEVTLQENFALQQETDDKDDKERMILSTIHQAKGLEWHTVFIINTVDGAFPNSRALIEPNGMSEERRLFYVAATRAQRQLFFTYPMIGGFSGELNQPSIFLGEIDPAKLEKARVENDYSGGEMVIEVDEEGNRRGILPDIDSL